MATDKEKLKKEEEEAEKKKKAEEQAKKEKEEKEKADEKARKEAEEEKRANEKKAKEEEKEGKKVLGYAVYGKNGIFKRTYTKEMHGEGFKKLAEDFAEKIGGKVQKATEEQVKDEPVRPQREYQQEQARRKEMNDPGGKI